MREFYYLDGNVIVIRENGETKYFLAFTDNIGSILAVIDEKGEKVFEATYDAWGNGENPWKAAGVSLLSSALSYGIGQMFGPTGNLGHELLRAGAHGVSSGITGALSNESLESSFLAGAISSGIGSGCQALNMDNRLMVPSASTIGGITAWATGGDFLQGALQGMQIAVMNHCQHDGDDGEQKRVQKKLKKEIEKDGVLSFREAKRWYQEGDGSSITVDADKIDLDFVNVST